MTIDYMLDSRLERIESARATYATGHTHGYPELKRAALYRQTKAQVEYDRSMRVKHRARELKRTFEERRKKSDWAMTFGSVIVRWPWAVVRVNGI